MPIFPELKEGNPEGVPDLSGLTPSMGELAGAAWSASRSEITERKIANDPFKRPAKHQIYGYTSPAATKEELAEITEGRHGLEIPEGTSLVLAQAMRQRYDDDKYYNILYQHAPSLLSKVAAFGSSGAAGLTDMQGNLFAIAASGGASLALKPIASRLLSKMAASEIFGSKAARVASTIAIKTAESAGEAAAGFAGYQASVESEEKGEADLLNKPYSYIEGLQHIGKSAEFGALFGVGTRILGTLLFGVKIPKFKTGEARDIPPDDGTNGPPGSGGTAPAGDRDNNFVRVGGIFQTDAFKNVAEKTKEIIAKRFKPWSEDADITMKEETVGQMLNGQAPNLDAIMKQGKVEEGENFRAILDENKVDKEELDNHLVNAQEEIQNKIKDEVEKTISPSEEELIYYRGRSNNTFGEKSLEAAGTNENQLMKHDHQFGKGYWYADSEEHAKNYGSVIEKTQGNYKIFDVENNDSPELTKMYEEIKQMSPADLLGTKNGRRKVKIFREAVKNAGYIGIRRFGVVGKDAGEYETMFFDKPKSQEELFQQKRRENIERLANEYLTIQAIRDHINDEHPPVTQDDVKAYNEHLKSVGLPKSDYVLPSAEEVALDNYLAEFDTNEFKEILERPELKEFKDEIAEGQKRIDNHLKYTDMVRQMITCITSGGL